MKMQDILLYLFPLVIVYAVIRGVMHLRAKRKIWAAQFFILAGFVTLFFVYELLSKNDMIDWMKFN